MQIIVFLTSTILILGVTMLLSNNTDLGNSQIVLDQNILMLNPVQKEQVTQVVDNGHIGFYVLSDTPIFTASEFYSPNSFNVDIDSQSPYILSYFYQAKDYFSVDSVQTPQRVVIHKKIELSGV
jgi:hypothetical protein